MQINNFTQKYEILIFLALLLDNSLFTGIVIQPK